MNTQYFQIDDFCCGTAKQQLEMFCDQHGWDCPDKVLTLWSDKSFILKAENADYGIEFCPWCGQNLENFYPITSGDKIL